MLHLLGDTMNFSRMALSFVWASLVSTSAFAQVKEPPRPETMDIQIRFRIRAERDERVRQYRMLEQHLQSLGFQDKRKDDPQRDLEILDPNSERFVGTIPSARVLDPLNDSRVLNILFAPAGYAYPDSPNGPVPIRVVLRDGLPVVQEQALHQQALAQLERLGFREALAYDTRGYTQLKGTIPLKNLNLLVKDLRTEPSGWFLTDTAPDQLPHPFADRNPVRWVEVMPAADAAPALAPELVLPARARMTPDLRAKLVDAASKDKPLLIEAVFATSLENQLEQLRTRLTNAFGPSVRLNSDGSPLKRADGTPILSDGASIEGVIGNVVTIRFDRPSDTERFAVETGILCLRLPRKGISNIFPALPQQTVSNVPQLLKSSGVETLQRLGYTGTGIKVVVVGLDFTGFEQLIGNALPRNTQLLDLTAELNPNLTPLPPEVETAAQSLAVARSVALAVPEVELVLVRIDSGSLFQLHSILRLARGEAFTSEALRSRLNSLSRRVGELNRRKDAALEEYRLAFGDLTDDEPARLRRERARSSLDGVLAEQKELAAQFQKFGQYQRDIPQKLAGAKLIVNPVVWQSGYPLDALSDFSRTLERIAAPPPPRSVRPATGRYSVPLPQTVWIQAAGSAAASAWAGPFRDGNRNGIMEFAPPNQQLPPGNWSSELNFLGFESASGEAALDLQAGLRLRIVMQWREPLEPLSSGLDPAYPVALRLLRQIDPNGEKRPSDEMAEEARSATPPYTISRTSTYAVYQQLLEYTIPAAGRYALMVSTGIPSDPRLPALRRTFEITPTLFVETLDHQAGQGQPTLRSYRNPQAGVGMPGDSPGAITVGVPGSLMGGGIGVTLLAKPNVLGPDSLNFGDRSFRGSGVASGYVAGIAAALVQAEVAGPNVFQTAGVAPGQLPILPEAWLRYLRPSRLQSKR